MSQKIIVELYVAYSGDVKPKPLKYIFSLNDVINIGRLKTNQIHIDLPEISRFHAALYVINERLFFEDFSSNKSYYKQGDDITPIHNQRIYVKNPIDSEFIIAKTNIYVAYVKIIHFG